MLKLTTKVKRWFTVEQDPSGDTEIEILHLKPGEVSEIESKVNTIVGKQIEGQEFATEIALKPHDRSKAYACETITNWKGICDSEGTPLECNKTNKLLVLAEFDWMSEFVSESREKLAKEVAKSTEEAEKN